MRDKLATETEKARQKIRAYTDKVQSLQEDVEDKDVKIDQLTGKVEIMQNNNNFIKKSYDSLQTKLKKLQTENIIIPKEKKGEGEEKKVEDDESPKNQVDDLQQNLQEEIRKLHFNLRHKDQIV